MSDIDIEPENPDFLDAMTQALQTDVALSLRSYGLASERTVQSMAGIIGPSDLGFCRQRAALMVRGVEQSDSKSIWPAQVGTAVHEYLARALGVQHPDWTLDSVKVTATFPSGYTVTGTPDAFGAFTFTWEGVDIQVFLVVDAKTVDGIEVIRRNGPTTNHRYQRTTYALGVKQAGLVPEGMALWVANVFLDRSGKVEEPLVFIEPFDESVVREVDDWIGDVIYAVKHNEDAMRDVAAPVCERICEHFTVCRGQLPVAEQDIIRDPEVVSWVELHQEGLALKKRGEKMKEEATERLLGMSALVITEGGPFQVRTTDVAESYQEGYMRRGYRRLDVRRSKS